MTLKAYTLPLLLPDVNTFGHSREFPRMGSDYVIYGIRSHSTLRYTTEKPIMS